MYVRVPRKDSTLAVAPVLRRHTRRTKAVVCNAALHVDRGLQLSALGCDYLAIMHETRRVDAHSDHSRPPLSSAAPPSSVLVVHPASGGGNHLCDGRRPNLSSVDPMLTPPATADRIPHVNFRIGLVLFQQRGLDLLGLVPIFEGRELFTDELMADIALSEAELQRPVFLGALPFQRIRRPIREQQFASDFLLCVESRDAVCAGPRWGLAAIEP
mmetsp:Transcript_22535/g.53295  ORF Transcript_22535/g.53295 Transcript_22535/m.53295 type:complete len:214 (+) Transcript_22535:95-736(+)